MRRGPEHVFILGTPVLMVANRRERCIWFCHHYSLFPSPLYLLYHLASTRKLLAATVIQQRSTFHLPPRAERQLEHFKDVLKCRLPSLLLYRLYIRQTCACVQDSGELWRRTTHCGNSQPGPRGARLHWHPASHRNTEQPPSTLQKGLCHDIFHLWCSFQLRNIPWPLIPILKTFRIWLRIRRYDRYRRRS